MSTGEPRPLGAAPAPSAPLGAALAAFAAGTVAPEHIDRVWIFPPRALGDHGESALAVVAVFDADAADADAARRRVYTVRAETASRGRGRSARTDHVAEQGIAPLERLPRVLTGVARRLGTEDAAPAEVEIDGDPARWNALLAAAPP